MLDPDKIVEQIERRIESKTLSDEEKRMNKLLASKDTQIRLLEQKTEMLEKMLGQQLYTNQVMREMLKQRS